MAVATFDTLKFANTLKAAGMPPAQAEAQAQAFAEVIQLNLKDLVTKDDLARAVEQLRGEISQLAKSTKADLDQLAKSTKADLDQLAKSTKADLDQLLKDFKVDLDKLGRDLRLESKEESLRMTNQYTRLEGRVNQVQWMLGLVVTLCTGILVRLFFFKP